jgi:hypothetical protein
MNKKTVVIYQSQYLPWKGYMDLINFADEFIIFDDVQYTRRDWRNRNKIKTPHGIHWLTIPVKVKGKFFQKIKDTEVSDPTWSDIHWRTIQFAYSKAPFFKKYKDIFEVLYTENTSKMLSEINHRFLTALCKILGIGTKLSWSSDYHVIDGKTERLVDLCQKAKATEYLTGPAAKDYIKEELFKKAGIKLKYMDYSDYLEYPQLYPPFEHKVSVIDLIFQIGPDAPRYMKSFR